MQPQRNWSLVLTLALLLSPLTPTPQVYAVACANPIFTTSNLDDSTVNSEDVEVVDIDGDSDLDVLVTSLSADVYWYENDGSANFTRSAISDATATNIDSIDTVDMDEDGDIDFVAGAENSGKIWLFLNDGNENFTASEIASLTDVKDVVAVELNGAGGIDVAAVSFSGNSVYWYANDGSENFGAGSLIASLGGALYIDTEDVNDDGDNDLVATGGTLTTGGTRYYENDGSGSFSTQSLSTLNDGAVEVVDIDQDGDQDILKSRGGFYFFENNGSESFSSNYTNVDPFNGSVNSLDTYDLDDDGDLDLIVSDTLGGFGWLENDGSEVFTANVIQDEGSFHAGVDAGDFDGDGDLDLFGISSLTNQPTLMLQSCDTTNPSISSLSPTDGETDVDSETNLVITFTEAVDVESGDITIHLASDDSTLETIDVTSGQVTGTGTDTITINPSVSLTDTSNQGFYVQIDATAFDDAAGNSFAGISDSSTWNFFGPAVGGRSDNTPPHLLSTTPAAGQSLESVSELELWFDDTVFFKPGNIYVHHSDGTLLESISIFSDQVTWTIQQNVPVRLSKPLEPGDYYILLDYGVIADENGNRYVGIQDSGSWTFTVLGATQETSGSPDSADSPDTPESLPFLGVLIFETEPETELCPDLFEDHWAYELLLHMIEGQRFPLDLSSSSALCRPQRTVTRAEFVAWLIELEYQEQYMNFSIDDLNESPFSDLELTHPYAKHVLLAQELGIISGHPDGSFKPDTGMNRAEALKILLHSFKLFDASEEFLLQVQGEFPTLDLLARYSDLTDEEAWFMPYLFYATAYELVEGRQHEESGVLSQHASMELPVLYSEAAKLLELTRTLAL